jgi:type IV pilus assembly protein PilP
VRVIGHKKMPVVWSRCLFIVMGLLIVTGLVAACGKKSGEEIGEVAASTAKQSPIKVEAPPKPVAVNVEKDSSVATFEYNSVGKRDPFWSFYKEGGRPGTGKAELPRSPLQMFEIDQLKLVAVIFGVAQPKAMVEAPDGKGYIVQLGTLVGKNFGRVTRIAHNELIISEEYNNGKGGKGVNTIHLTLEKDKETEQ